MYHVYIKPVEGAADSVLPQRATTGSAGYDVRAFLPKFAGVYDNDICLSPGERVVVRTGFQIAMPPELEVQIRSRSGLAAKHGVSVLNSPGTIDSDFRGEVGVILINHGTMPFVIKNGDRIAQIVFHEVPTINLKLTDRPITDFWSTDRGAGGFGSTGAQ